LYNFARRKTISLSIPEIFSGTHLAVISFQVWFLEKTFRAEKRIVAAPAKRRKNGEF